MEEGAGEEGLASPRSRGCRVCGVEGRGRMLRLSPTRSTVFIFACFSEQQRPPTHLFEELLWLLEDIQTEVALYKQFAAGTRKVVHLQSSRARRCLGRTVGLGSLGGDGLESLGRGPSRQKCVRLEAARVAERRERR